MHHVGDAPDLMMDDAIRQLYRDIPEDDRNPGVHIMTGPIFVEDAKPGDILDHLATCLSADFDINHSTFQLETPEHVIWEAGKEQAQH